MVRAAFLLALIPSVALAQDGDQAAVLAKIHEQKRAMINQILAMRQHAIDLFDATRRSCLAHVEGSCVLARQEHDTLVQQDSSIQALLQSK